MQSERDPIFCISGIEIIGQLIYKDRCIGRKRDTSIWFTPIKGRLYVAEISFAFLMPTSRQ